jgi:hypothetical protein
MIVSIHQPGYLPWHGFFHRLALSDLHILFDTAQFEKNGFNNRVKIRTAQGEQWLTVPILAKGRFGNNPIKDAQTNPTVAWQENHWKTITQSYGRATYFSEHSPFFRDFYTIPWTHLGPLNITALTYLARALGINCRLVKASELSVTGQKSELVLNLCRAVGATTYISGVNGRDYLDRRAFADAGVELRFQCYKEPHYQQFRQGFRPYISVVDLLFHHGPAAREIMMTRQDTLETGTVPD